MDKESAKKARAILLEEAFRRRAKAQKEGTYPLDSEDPWSWGYRNLPDQPKKN